MATIYFGACYFSKKPFHPTSGLFIFMTKYTYIAEVSYALYAYVWMAWIFFTKNGTGLAWKQSGVTAASLVS